MRVEKVEIVEGWSWGGARAWLVVLVFRERSRPEARLVAVGERRFTAATAAAVRS
jgi:hypothetical protein